MVRKMNKYSATKVRYYCAEVKMTAEKMAVFGNISGDIYDVWDGKRGPRNTAYITLCSVSRSCPTLFDPWTVARQAPLSVRFPRQEHWSGLPFPSPGDLPDPRDQTQTSCIAGRFLTV